MKIIDCFTFFNELDLLEFRLKLLDSSVDKFVIAESNLTHSGETKPYLFEENRQRFEPWLHKIHYISLQQNTEGLVFDKAEPAYNPDSSSWKLENEQRNALSIAGALANDDDLVLISDLDEIPDPAVLKKLTGLQEPVALSLLFHYYFLNCQQTAHERWWKGCIVTTGKQFRQHSPQYFRDNRNQFRSLTRSGWHFSFLGGLEKIKCKILSFAHTEYNKAEYLQDDYILDAITKGRDIFKRPNSRYRFFSIYFYPPYLRKTMLQYPSLLHLIGKDRLLQRWYYSLKRLFSR